MIIPRIRRRGRECGNSKRPNIKPFPKGNKLEENIVSQVALVAGDNITTDHIMPAGRKSFPTGRISPTCPNTALPYATANFPRG